MAGTRNNLGGLYREQLRHEEAIREYREAVARRPDRLAFRYHLLRAMNCCPDIDASYAYKTTRAVGEFIENKAPPLFESYQKVSDRIRIGYIGSTLRQHSVAYFLQPIIENHSNQFEVYCYNIGDTEDSTTKRISEECDHYRHLHDQSSESIARQIHRDGINILVELDGYTELVTLAVLAHSPAPVQVSWIGYPETTGMTRIRYRIVDNFTDPPGGVADGLCTEQLIRMTTGFSVYSAPSDSPDVEKAPALEKGNVTFGSFNLPLKMNPRVIETWARILHAIPSSTLLLKHGSFEKKSMVENIYSAFGAHGLDRERLLLSGFEATMNEHLRRYHEIDIALDPFPYNGTTTSLEALWMGVPVITIAGEKHVSRIGVSLMSNIGHPEWIAEDCDQYVAIARKLALDLEKLDSIRLELREKMSSSPLMDGPTFVTELEQKFMEILRWK